jgi:hypothetical protein
VKIERLTFVISPPSESKTFVDLDRRIWTTWLQTQPGFIRKDAQIYQGGRVEMQIFWKDEASHNKAAARPDVESTEIRFKSLFPGLYRLVYSS